MDKITLKNMKFYAYHGFFPEEQEKGQTFFVDVEMYLDVSNAGKEDDLNKTVDYSAVYGLVKDVVTNNIFRLIETLADRISREILSKYKNVSETIVRVRKPEAPLGGELDWAEVEIRRQGDE